jgi:hypothetical protein
VFLDFSVAIAGPGGLQTLDDPHEEHHEVRVLKRVRDPGVKVLDARLRDEQAETD